MTLLRVLIAAAIAGSVVTHGASAAALPKTNIKVVGITSNNVMYSDLEVPFYTKQLVKQSGGAVTAELKPFDELGLKGTELLRLLKNGSLEYASGWISYMAPDSPKFEGCDLAGVALGIHDARKACEAYKPILDKLMKEKWNIKLLALGPTQPQVFWCRIPVTSIQDLKGKKIRVFNQTLTDFVSGLGATSVTIPFTDVVPALQRGVADCAVTGVLSGNTAHWWEVTSDIYNMAAGWSIMFWAVNDDVWKGYSPALRSFMTREFHSLENQAWALGAKATEQANICNTGGAGCTLGLKAHMKVVQPSAADMKAHEKIVDDYVLPDWAKRCGSECAQQWNETVGKALGIKAPTKF
jgi:TRAP-type C4-dicarboxylate transport system substrate-binding protein